jgi:hypothetical protein
MLLPFVRWLYDTPSPDTPPYGLLPNTSESSGTPNANALGVLLRALASKLACYATDSNKAVQESHLRR